eukprot:5632406-Amphidinium_carterae.1
MENKDMHSLGLSCLPGLNCLLLRSQGTVLQTWASALDAGHLQRLQRGHAWTAGGARMEFQ